MNIFRNPDNGFSAPLTSTMVDSPTKGATTMSIPEAGEFYLWSYTACPWEVTIETGGGADYIAGAVLRDKWLAWDNAIGGATGRLVTAKTSEEVANIALESAKRQSKRQGGLTTLPPISGLSTRRHCETGVRPLLQVMRWASHCSSLA
jgi:hypothetical protein